MSSELPSPGASDESTDDAMAPPRVACECSCLHCGRVFMSDQMWFQRVVGDPSGFDGFWMCPTSNCSGAGFTFDIFPTDPAHPANEGWHTFEDESDTGGDEDDAEWDPEEPQYRALDEEDPDDIEGEEWKHGLQPGERPEPEWLEEARRREAERQREFDEPDRRPREIHWREQDHPKRNGPFNEDDIPF